MLAEATATHRAVTVAEYHDAKPAARDADQTLRVARPQPSSQQPRPSRRCSRAALAAERDGAQRVRVRVRVRVPVPRRHM
jgi:hypothetical protein